MQTRALLKISVSTVKWIKDVLISTRNKVRVRKSRKEETAGHPAGHPAWSVLNS